MKSEIVRHYDLLIDENNDPVHDPKSLQNYMDKWDGQTFIDKMELDKDNLSLKSALVQVGLPFASHPNAVNFSALTFHLKQ